MSTPAGVAERQLAVLTNPGAANANRCASVVNDLIMGWEGGFGYIPVATSRDPDETRRRIQALPPNSVIAAAVGDGGLSQAANADHPFIIIPAGTENDMAAMINNGVSPGNVLFGYEERLVRPLHYSFSRWDEEAQSELVVKEGYALYALGVGVNGKVAADFNTQEVRSDMKRRGEVGRWIAKRRLALHELNTQTPFETSDGPIIDLIVANGQRMAGGALKFPVEITEDRFFVGITRRSWWSRVINVISGMRGLSIGLRTTSPYNIKIGDIADDQPVYGQADGEHFEVPANTTLRIGLADVALKFWSPKPYIEQPKPMTVEQAEWHPSAWQR